MSTKAELYNQLSVAHSSLAVGEYSAVEQGVLHRLLAQIYSELAVADTAGPIISTGSTASSIAATLLVGGILTGTAGFRTGNGNTAAPISGTAVSLFTPIIGLKARYDFVAIVANAGVNYIATAIVINEGTVTSLLRADNSANLALTVVAGDIKGTQTSGGFQDIVWAYTMTPL